ncbi:MAG TPA: 5-(carboxyamino)imidazole ribonucleotide synthase [Algoriphagus sp.]|jgi:5-(carboxyamino)imidazole ribonucleotide synthase|uniref:5-(carboxyamino)imidazole ribonucleotide synthase n=1 Tax=unclassified Algoriphagus TaxID=2641541 RepID=UPI000C43F516|nr:MULTISPECIES: 5-(carboxyamino)imidazole ribonucleotide synthase [unclassified Algoriphagus]MAL14773.1 5-(carboxyamino)imidazole ribonucleotide synthase [Algoriphagus sp.]MAN85521.1 5-(carboxyamino)imidazole ribonucleotide synthase [Algoriphagus sp.]HAD50243.1 5-(carboxyamino)imidazole ribonucleotide synthase [Algoriphagus sp.]HAH36556.1 5-(carboxyamino)imidazole ribonucleotide synthase [Algoriphagus sp.]HAS60348.1 5-(carboxyamino)imidazole ribonucleotide synthase [Algoriphagus sp.]|tara:strand:+ start:8352 stop:9488 length:1137 start_codon:yes stop_codon:yes gene_type:complete
MKSAKSSILGVLGGGQLGRMLIQSAINYNQDIHILDPDPQAPCKDLAQKFTCGSLKDFDTVYAFGQDCDVITVEIESVNTDALAKLESEGKQVFPQPHILKLIQDKREQKQFYQKNGIPTAEFILTENKAEVIKNKGFLPAVNKLGKEGYDGRGVQILRSESDLDQAFDAPGLLEKLIDFDKEIAVTVARNKKGDLIAYPAVECAFHPTANLVEFLFAPAEIADSVEKKAQEIAKEVILKLDMVGILAVEMFVTKSGDVLVNEIAPRPHNSGHHTIEANFTSQFEQHLRSVMNWPLGNPELRCPAAMINLLGEDGFTGEAIVEGQEDALSEKGVYIHLYGKKLTKPFRKMGHVTLLDEDIEQLKVRAQRIKDLIKIKA